MQKKEKTTYTKTEVKSRGWTDTMIKNLLPPPELKPVPGHPSWGPMSIWKITTVEEVEKTEAFQQALAKAEKRKFSAQKAVITKYKNNMEYVQEQIKKIEVKEMSMQGVYQNAASWHETSPKYVDDDVMQRWAVNFVRHELTVYDDELYHFAGKVGTYDMYTVYRSAVLDKIAEVYPDLKQECERQKR